MICMGMYWNGAGIGSAVIRVKRRQIHEERFLALIVCIAAAIILNIMLEGFFHSFLFVRQHGTLAFPAKQLLLLAFVLLGIREEMRELTLPFDFWKAGGGGVGSLP